MKLILALLWSLIAHYQLGASNFPPKKLMLAWLKVSEFLSWYRNGGLNSNFLNKILKYFSKNKKYFFHKDNSISILPSKSDLFFQKEKKMSWFRHLCTSLTNVLLIYSCHGRISFQTIMDSTHPQRSMVIQFLIKN